MDDPVFPSSQSTPTPAPKPAAAPDPNLQALLARLEKQEAANQQLTSSNQQLMTHMSTLVSAVQQLQQQVTTPPAKPAVADTVDPVTALTQDPDAYIATRAKAVMEETLNGQTAINSRLVDTLHANILRDREADITNRYGTAAWSEIIKPNLDKLLTQTRTTNRLGLADETLIDAFVNKIKGENLEALADAKVKADTARAEAATQSKESLLSTIRSELPPVGLRRRQSSDDRLDPKDIPGLDLMRKEIEAATGQKTNLDTFMKVHTAGTNDIETILERLEAPAAGAAH